MSESSDIPYKFAAAVVNNVDFAAPSRGIYVGGAGNISAKMVGGGTVVYTAVALGKVLPIQATQVTTANTTATLLIALW